jgi:succinate dehydrogenase / fumarate reductase, flavoprotein subunit
MEAYQDISTDVLIIGQGAAGLRAAIALKERGVSCLVLSKRGHGDAHTKWAAGGINASLGSLDAEDRWQIHAADTLREGWWVCNPKAVELLARHAPARIKELQDWGCPFSLTDNGTINQRYFGAQSFRRTCFVGDRTGEAMLQTLISKAEESGVPSRVHTYVMRLLSEGGRVAGALGFDRQTGEKLVFRAKAVVLACGGFASIYNRSSSRYDENTADNVGLGFAAGATLQDMEFVQFHPTGMIKPAHMLGRLVSEAVRGEGGQLLNKQRERFMEKYSPDKMELDARDVVARAIYQEIQEGRGTEDGGVWLDISHKGADFIRERLPKLVAQFSEQGIDFTKEAVEVAPTAHYAMGGLRVDFETGETGVPGLYAVGEATAGVHGANRLGGNSLAETVVFGQLTGAHLARVLPSLPAVNVPESSLQQGFATMGRIIGPLAASDPQKSIREIGQLLWAHAGIVRDRRGLEEGLQKLNAIAARQQPAQGAGFSGSPEDWEKACNLHFILQAAEAVMQGALLREESRGAHYRKDAPEPGEHWKKNIYYCRQGGQMQLFCEPVGPVAAEIQQALDQEYSLNYHHLE